MSIESIKNTEFSTADLARLAGISPRKAQSWLEHGYISPSVCPASGHASRRLFDFNDIVDSLLVADLIEAGFSPTAIRGIKLPNGEPCLVNFGGVTVMISYDYYYNAALLLLESE